mgnify:FL=1
MLSLVLYLTLLFLSGCDKLDCNDGLDGQWQMLEWKSADGEIVANKEAKIYYCFQLQMMMFQKLSAPSTYVFSSFHNQQTSIRIYDPIKYKGDGHDLILSMDTLKQYGVPSDGLMKIDRLSNDTLVLSSNETGRLIFRKY